MQRDFAQEGERVVAEVGEVGRYEVFGLLGGGDEGRVDLEGGGEEVDVGGGVWGGFWHDWGG